MRVRLAATFLAFTAGNFLYQWLFGSPNWEIAVERSYFQGTIVLWIAFVGWRANQ